MAIPERPRFKSIDPRFLLLQTDDGSFTLEEAATGNTFHSGCGAIAECWHVYAKNSGVEQRLATGQKTRVLELGFGTGLAFLVTASLARQYATDLQYVSFEKRPLPSRLCEDVLRRSQAVEPIAQEIIDDLARALLQFETAGWCDSQHAELNEGRCKFTLHVCDLKFENQFPRQSQPDQHFDAVYFDPFDPASNPEAWSSAMYQAMYSMLVPGGCLVSYCVKSDVRRELTRVGFEAERVPGPVGGKREVLIARRPR